MALAAGAISVTTNPAYCSKLLKSDPDFIYNIIDQVVKDVDDDDEAADVVCQQVTIRFLEQFLPLYERSGGQLGFVTIQDDPRCDEDPDAIVNASLRHSKLGKNYMAKVPVTVAGIEAMKRLVERDVPITATECFLISQAIAMCELYQNVSRKSGKHSPFLITHITGIYDEEIKDYVSREKVNIAPELVEQAGCIVGRKEYRLLKERGYQTTMLGGACGLHHFTEFVGGDLHLYCSRLR